MIHGFFGFGNLAQALVERFLLDESKTQNQRYAYDRPPCSHERVIFCETLADLCQTVDILWLCIKPQQWHGLTEQEKNIIGQCSGLVSPMAGISLDQLSTAYPHVSILRIMPNIAARFGSSLTAYAFHSSESDEKMLGECLALLEQCGSTVMVSDGDFGSCTALFGSGPGLLLAMLQPRYQAMESLGRSHDHKCDALVQLLRGTADVIAADHDHLDAIIMRIASPGGTTQAGLDQARHDHLGESITAMLDASRERAEVLSQRG